ncbi:MAG: DUF4345 domain-containing protein [Pseudomonadales bacterium]|nr:DUF4345 domain-containing protein [Pseudomonadales bacterium]NRA14205.1 DUF4345 domain-containing protein [Oceanospirillaceae bacterium]
MRNSKFLKTVLFLSGLIAAGIGASILLDPVAFHGASGIKLADNINLLNEMRAAGGALMAIGVLIILGCFINRLTYTATLVASLMYLAYGFSRVLSFAFDGLPTPALVQVAVLEIAIGALCIYCLIKYRALQNV